MTLGAEPFVSVVTPFHNTEPYLAECIESVLNQSYKNFEYILVDNQSTDRSGEIAARYAAKDARIRVFRTDRLLPQLANYNFAFSQMAATSQYCKMVQADDWIFPHCLREMVSLAEANPNVAIVSSYRLVESEVTGGGIHPSQTVLSGREAGRLFLLQGLFPFGSPTTVLYRADIVRSRGSFFGEDRFHADTEAAFEILADHDFGFVHQILSFTRRANDSLTASKRNFFPERLDRLIVVKRFGASYLTPNENAACTRRSMASYYRALAGRWILDRIGRASEPFWRYHRAGLRTIGETVEPWRLAQGVAGLALDNVVSPSGLVRRVKRVIAG